MSSRVGNEQSKPKNSKFKQKFKQQRLPAWQPILTADTVLPAFFLIGLLFIPLGVALLHFSIAVKEKQLDYTDCESVDPSHKLATGGGKKCADLILEPGFNGTCRCKIDFYLEETFPKMVYLYYGLDNFYQNHRRYVKSRDDKQLLGKPIDAPSSDCSPFDKDSKGQPFAPCGAIANSLFNDTFALTDNDNSDDNEVKLLKTNISWPSDKAKKFKNPGSLDPTSEKFGFKNTSKPMYWRKPVYELDLEDPSNNGYENEDLIVWMRTAAFPNFRKLYRRIDHDVTGYKTGLPMGNYTLKIDYNYPVSSFSGRKRMILSTTSFLGGKNNFLGIAYITVGSICLLLGVIFLVIHIKFGKRASDHLNINQNTPYSD